MAWCPVCKSEYRDGISVCPECKVALTAAAPEAEPQARPAAEQFVLLASFEDESQKVMAMAALEQAGIPVYLRDIGAGSFVRIFTGGTVFGSALYVPISCQKQAMSLIARFLLPQDSEPCDPQLLEGAYEEYMKTATPEAEETTKPVSPGGYRLLFWFLGIFAAIILVALIARYL